jgi:hypothetical protein
MSEDRMESLRPTGPRDSGLITRMPQLRTPFARTVVFAVVRYLRCLACGLSGLTNTRKLARWMREIVSCHGVPGPRGWGTTYRAIGSTELCPSARDFRESRSADAPTGLARWTPAFGCRSQRPARRLATALPNQRFVCSSLSGSLQTVWQPLSLFL